MPETTKSTDRILLSLCIIALCSLTFIGGVAFLHYKLPVSQQITASFEQGREWYQNIKSRTSPTLLSNQDVEQETAQPDRDYKVTWDKKNAYNGYTTIFIDFSSKVYLVDMDGKVAYHWHMPFEKVWPDPKHVARVGEKIQIYISRARVFPNGDLLILYSALGDTPYGYGMAKIDKDSQLIWKYSDNAHHDFYIDNEDNIYAITQSFVTAPKDNPGKLIYPILNDYIVKLSQDGKELERISILDAFLGTPFELLLYGNLKTHKIWDPLHTNSIMKLEPEVAKAFPMFKPGYLLISMRTFNIVAVIDPHTKKVVWAYNGLWKQQHSAVFLDTGNILLLDNRGHAEEEKLYSRLIEINPATLEVKWSYTGSKERPFFTHSWGRVQRLPNGNTLVTETARARLFEVTRQGKIVWDYKKISTKRNLRLGNGMRYSADSLPFLKDQPHEAH